MASNKSFQKTEHKPVTDGISVNSGMVRESVQRLEERIETDFPFAVKETAIAHKNLQEARYHYLDALSESIENDRIRRGKRTEKGELIEENEDYPKFKIVPVKSHRLNRLLAGFFDYLSGFGEVSISSYYEICINQRRGTERFGVHIKRNDDKTPVFFGFIDEKRDAKSKVIELNYDGYVPGSEGSEINPDDYNHLGPADMAFDRYVRLFYDVSRQERIDGWNKKGIPFP